MPENSFYPNNTNQPTPPQQGQQGKLILRPSSDPRQPQQPQQQRPSYPQQQRSPYPPQQPYPQQQQRSPYPPQQPYPQQQYNPQGAPYPPPGNYPYYPGQPGRPPQRKPSRPWLRALIIIFVVLLVAGGVGYAYYQSNYGNSLNNITSQSAIHAKNTNTRVNPDILNQRTNIVLLGSDTDGKGNDPTNGTPLAQTVIIITVEPQSHYVGMLSIPRDMQVSDPTTGFANEKLDEAFEHAWIGKDANERARAAAGHMMDVIEKNYGIHIDHYAWVGLQGFIKVITTVDGVDVDVTHPVEDDLYPDDTNNPTGNAFDYKRLYLPPGPQHLDGPTALEYVRTRHADLGGDFGRTERQQQVLSQLKEKLSSANTISQAPQLLKDLDGFLMTDLSLVDLTSFAEVAKGIETSKIQHVSLTPPTYAATGLPRNNFGPLCDQVNQIVQQMFKTQPQCLTQTANASSPSHAIAQAVPQHATTLSATSPHTTGSLSSVRGPITAPTDIHNVLDLLLLTTFGSFDAVH